MGKTGRKKNKINRKPVSAHPLFPTVLALWFAALLGLSCMAVKPALLDVLLFRYGLAALVGDAGAATGLPDQVVLALALSALGFLVGTTAARLVRRVTSRGHAAAPEMALQVPVVEANRDVMPEDPRRDDERAELPAPAPEPQPTRQPAPQVLDISAMELTPQTHGEPLDLTVLAPDEDPLPEPGTASAKAPVIHPLSESQWAGDAEPVVIFPGRVEAQTAQEPASGRDDLAYGQLDREATERVLRTALTNLQRLRGAA